MERAMGLTLKEKENYVKKDLTLKEGQVFTASGVDESNTEVIIDIMGVYEEAGLVEIWIEYTGSTDPKAAENSGLVVDSINNFQRKILELDLKLTEA